MSERSEAGELAACSDGELLGELALRLRTAGAGVDPLHPYGQCTCAAEGTCEWCLRGFARDIATDLARHLPVTETSPRAARAAELIEACAGGLVPHRGTADADRFEALLHALAEKLRARGGERVEVVMSIVWAGTPGICRVCGCTEDRACPRGCAWADSSQTLCTACNEQPASQGPA